MHTHSEVVSIVNEVIETLNERESGYRIAGQNINELTLRGVLAGYENQSSKFIQDLLPFSDETSPEDIGKGPLGTVYQGWMNLKEKITGHDTQSILGDCVTGEEAALKTYHTALKDEDLPADLKVVLDGQFKEIRKAQEKIRNLKESTL